MDDGDARASDEAVFCRLQTEVGEGDVDNGGDDEQVDGHVWGPSSADTRDRRRWRLQRRSGNDNNNNNNNNNNNKGGSHPTPGTMATRKLAARLRSAGIPYTLEASLSGVEKANGQR